MKKRTVMLLALALILSFTLITCDDLSEIIKDPLTGSVSVNNTSPKVGDTVIAAYNHGNGSGTPSWQWYSGNVLISGANSNAYQVKAADEGKALMVQLSYADQTGSLSASTGIVAPAIVSQNPAATDFNIAGLLQTYNGNPRPVSISPIPGKSTGLITIYYEGTEGTVYPRSTTAPSAVGKYAVSFNVAAVTGWNSATGLSAGILTINSSSGNFPNPGAVNETYKPGLTLGEVTLPAGYAWAAPSILLNAGNNQFFDATYTDPSGNYNTTNGMIAVNIAKANPSVTWPSGLNGTYGQTLSQVAITGGSGSPAGTFSWTSPGTSVGNAGTQTHSMTFTPSDTFNYNAGASFITITVNKANPSVTWPSSITAVYGQTLSQVAITGGSGNPAGTFSWTTPGTSVGNAGSRTHNMTFTPNNTANYNTAANNVTITVNKATGAAVSVPALNTSTNNSITATSVTLQTQTGQSVEYAISTNSGLTGTSLEALTWQSGTVFTGLSPNTNYFVYARSASNTNYNAGTASTSVVISTLPTVSQNRFEYFWVDAHGSLVTTSGGATTVAPGDTLTITAQGQGYEIKQWHLNGFDTGQSGSTYTFSSTANGTTHSVGLFVEKDGKLYNTNIFITVQ